MQGQFRQTVGQPTAVEAILQIAGAGTVDLTVVAHEVTLERLVAWAPTFGFDA